MRSKRMRIGVVAPASRIDFGLADRARAIAHAAHGDRVELVFHPQCFLAAGHFAGDDDARAQAFLEIANDVSFDALWWARGGYGSNRIAAAVIAGLSPAARGKLFIGYSDAGFLLGPLYKAGMRVAHGPVIADLNRDGMNQHDPETPGHCNGASAAAIRRVLSWIVDRDPSALEPEASGSRPLAAFNLTVFANIVGTPFQPDLAGHVLMLEEVSEHMYAIDRMFFHVTSNPAVRQVAGIMLGRCSDVPDNDPPFEKGEEDVARHWCEKSGIPYLGRADIGHDIDNKIVPFGAAARPNA